MLQDISKGYGSGDRQRDLQVRKTPVPLYFCPSRRENVISFDSPGSAVPVGCSQGCALNDYAGATPANELNPQSPSRDPWFWQEVGHGAVFPGKKYFGVITRTVASLPCTDGKVADGHSKTMMVGEKRLYTNRYRIGDCHDDIGWTDGWDPDIMRCTGYQPGPDIRQGAPSDPGASILATSSVQRTLARSTPSSPTVI